MNPLDFFGIRPTIRRALSAPIGKLHILFPAAFLVALGLNILNFGIIFFMSDTFHSSPGEIGTLSALWSLSYFTGCFLLRPLGRRLAPRYSMMIATAAMALWLSAVVVFRSKGVTFLAYGLSGLSNSLFFPPLMTWLANGIEGERLNKAMSRFSLSWSLGGVLSPYLAGFIVERRPVYALIACVFFLVVTCIIIVIAAVRIKDLGKDDQPLILGSNGNGGEKDGSTFFRFPAWIGNYSMYVMVGILNAVFPLYARDDLFLKESAIGMIFLLRALLVTTGFLFFGRITSWHFNGRFIVTVQLLFSAGIASLLFVRSFAGFLFLVPLQGLFLSAQYSSSVFHGASGAAERQKRMAIHESILTAGVITGAILGGFVYQHGSMHAVFFMALGISLAAVAAQSVLLSVKRSRGIG